MRKSQTIRGKDVNQMVTGSGVALSSQHWGGIVCAALVDKIHAVLQTEADHGTRLLTKLGQSRNANTARVLPEWVKEWM